MADGTIESLTLPPADQEAFIAEASQVIEQHFAPEPEAPPETNPSETPNSSSDTSLPSAEPAKARDSVEPSEASASEAEATPANATPGEAKPNEAVQPPASWQMDEVTRQLLRNRGVSDEVVRDIRSPEQYQRVLEHLLSQPAAPQQVAPSPPATPQEPSALEKFLNDPLQDQDMVAAVRAMQEQSNQVRQQLAQIQQGTQAQQQAIAQQRYRELTKAFDQTLDQTGYDVFGKSSELGPEHIAMRERVWDKLNELARSGIVKELSAVSVEQAFALAAPTEFKEQLRRQTVSAAQAQSSNRLSVGRPSPSPAREVDDFADARKKGKELGLSP